MNNFPVHKLELRVDSVFDTADADASVDLLLESVGNTRVSEIQIERYFDIEKNKELVLVWCRYITVSAEGVTIRLPDHVNSINLVDKGFA